MAEPNQNQNQAAATDPVPGNSPNPAPAPAQGGKNYEELFDKLDNILSKRSEGLAKSALKDNGLEDEEIKTALSEYRARKAQQAQEIQNNLATLTSENQALKAQILQGKIESAAARQALGLGLEAKSVSYLVKMADLQDAVNDEGEIDEEKVKSAIEKVLEDVPGLKPSATQNTGFVKVGAQGGNPDPSHDDRLRRAFGLK